jgi:hypothetical protein
MQRSGYSFQGWATSASGALAYGQGSTFIINSNTILYALWVVLPTPPSVITYTVTFEPGEHGTFVAQRSSDLVYGVSTPAAPTVTGEIGWVFIGWTPELQSTVTSNVVYIAQWDAETHQVVFIDWNGEVISEQTVTHGWSAVPPANPTREGHVFAGWDQDFSSVVGDMVIRAQYVEALIIEPELPPEPVGSWALINLILTVFGFVFSLGMLLAFVSGRRNNQADEQYGYEVQETSRRRSLTFRLLNISLAVIALLVFIITQDMKYKMVIFDWWTIIHLIIVVVQIAFGVLASNRKEEDESEPAW